jgi:hypothetical protein
MVFILTDDLDARSISYMPKLKSLLIDPGTRSRLAGHKSGLA